MVGKKWNHIRKHYYWEDIVYDFNCMKGGRQIQWEFNEKGVQLFMDGKEVNTTDYYYCGNRCYLHEN